MQTPEFEKQIEELIKLAKGGNRPDRMMGAEAVPLALYRSLIGDANRSRNSQLRHYEYERARLHTLTPRASRGQAPLGSGGESSRRSKEYRLERRSDNALGHNDRIQTSNGCESLFVGDIKPHPVRSAWSPFSNNKMVWYLLMSRLAPGSSKGSENLPSRSRG